MCGRPTFGRRRNSSIETSLLEGNFVEGHGEIVDTPHLDSYLQAIIESTGKLSRSVKVAVVW